MREVLVLAESHPRGTLHLPEVRSAKRPAVPVAEYARAFALRMARLRADRAALRRAELRAQAAELVAADRLAVFRRT